MYFFNPKIITIAVLVLFTLLFEAAFLDARCIAQSLTPPSDQLQVMYSDLLISQHSKDFKIEEMSQQNQSKDEIILQLQNENNYLKIKEYLFGFLLFLILILLSASRFYHGAILIRAKKLSNKLS